MTNATISISYGVAALVTHLVHNVTGLPVAGMPTIAQSPSTYLAPSKEAVPSTAVAPSTPKKTQTEKQPLIPPI